MAKGLKGLYEQYVVHLQQAWSVLIRLRHAGVLDGNSNIDREAVLKVRYIHEFDR